LLKTYFVLKTIVFKRFVSRKIKDLLWRSCNYSKKKKSSINTIIFGWNYF